VKITPIPVFYTFSSERLASPVNCQGPHFLCICDW